MTNQFTRKPRRYSVLGIAAVPEFVDKGCASVSCSRNESYKRKGWADAVLSPVQNNSPGIHKNNSDNWME
jgi:hypothetical protein